MGNCIKQSKVTAHEFIKEGTAVDKDLISILKNGKALETASAALKETKQVAAMAIVSAPEAIKFVGKNLKNDAHLAALALLVSKGKVETDLSADVKDHPLVKHVLDFVKNDVQPPVTNPK